jgi:nicotinamidase-related amidase
MSDILLIVDMLNDFAHEDGTLFFPKAKRIIPHIQERLKEYRMRRILYKGLDKYNVVYACDRHEPHDKEFERFPKHAIANTWGARVVDELAPINPLVEEKIVDKTRFDAFFGTPLAAILEQLRPPVVEIVGVCTSICIMDTVAGLVARDYKVHVPEHCVADLDNDAHEYALNRMEGIYGAIVYTPHNM